MASSGFAIVTGANTGLGLHLVKSLYASGTYASIVLACRIRQNVVPLPFPNFILFLILSPLPFPNFILFLILSPLPFPNFILFLILSPLPFPNFILFLILSPLPFPNFILFLILSPLPFPNFILFLILSPLPFPNFILFLILSPHQITSIRPLIALPIRPFIHSSIPSHRHLFRPPFVGFFKRGALISKFAPHKMFHSPVHMAERDENDDDDNDNGILLPTSLQATLDHPHTFGTFCHWIAGTGRAHVLDFWLAIWAFRRAWLERDPRAQRIGVAFHRRFVSPRTGCCDFLPASLRADCSERLQREPMRGDFFDACIPHAWACLTREHVQFVLHAAKKQQIGGAALEQQQQQFVPPSEKQQQRLIDLEGDAEESGRDAECNAFALQLAHKLHALATERRQWTTAAAAAGRTAGDSACGYFSSSRRKTDVPEEQETAVTPERMCAWMRFASAHSGLTALSSSCYYADGKSSSSSSTTGGYMTFKQNIPPPSAAAAVEQQQQQQQQRHSDSAGGDCMATSTASSSMGASSGGGGGGAVPMTITYREAGGFGPPFVVRVAPQATVTFREFRRLFAIPLRSNKRFLFKEHRFDAPRDSAHFQWTAIYEDGSALPMFCGQIVAECRTLSESD
uniref:DIX domain-containing protein n=1 Tax=Globodera rostochiensis TaxID=31243 RepID=A0A914HFT6_GLORO